MLPKNRPGDRQSACLRQTLGGRYDRPISGHLHHQRGHDHSKIVSYYQTAKQHWEGFFAEHEDTDLATWSNWLTSAQVSFFEQDCGGRWIGQEIMVWSGFGVLYTTAEGFDDDWPTAKKLFQAFQHSMCSIEVKHKVEKAAAFYSVND